MGITLEKNGPILFVKAFALPDPLEIDCNLDPVETYVLKKICPDYSVTCINKHGKLNRKDVDLFRIEEATFPNVILFGKQCTNLLGIKYEEWERQGHLEDEDGNYAQYYWTVPPISRIGASKRHIDRMKQIVRDIKNEEV